MNVSNKIIEVLVLTSIVQSFRCDGDVPGKISGPSRR